MKNNIIFYLLLFFFITSSKAYSDNLILPGVRINGAYMDMNFDIIQKGWGVPDSKQEQDGGVSIYRNKKYQTIFYVVEGKLAMVETFSSSFRTQSGIKVGSQRLDLTDKLGAPMTQENYPFTCFDGSSKDLYALVYKGDGIGFSFDPSSNKVFSIFVFPAGKYINHLAK